MTRNSAQPPMFTRNVAVSSCDAYALVSAMPAGTYNAYAKTRDLRPG